MNLHRQTLLLLFVKLGRLVGFEHLRVPALVFHLQLLRQGLLATNFRTVYNSVKTISSSSLFFLRLNHSKNFGLVYQWKIQFASERKGAKQHLFLLKWKNQLLLFSPRPLAISKTEISGFVPSNKKKAPFQWNQKILFSESSPFFILFRR